jgi:signal transduction histidine kinase
MTGDELVWINQSMTTQSSVGGETHVEVGTDVGVVVLDHDGRVTSSNSQARELLRAGSPATLDDRLREIQYLLLQEPTLNGSMDETAIDVPEVGLIALRSCTVAGPNGEGRVLLLRDAQCISGTTRLLDQAARFRSFSFLSRDWAHDLKGMLHVIRINSALLGRLTQRESSTPNPALTKCLDAIPREVDRLDAAVELMLNARTSDKPSSVDLGAICERLKSLIAARAIRQRTELVFELKGGSKEVIGFEDQIRCALLNVVVNALEAMPEQGRLVISVEGDRTAVRIRISDNGPGLPPQLRDCQWRPHFVNDRQRTGIGLHVTRAIVESHGGRIECASNVPHGTCIEITFPSASTGRLGYGSRTHR